jgi:hypothetical protein
VVVRVWKKVGEGGGSHGSYGGRSSAAANHHRQRPADPVLSSQTGKRLITREELLLIVVQYVFPAAFRIREASSQALSESIHRFSEPYRSGPCTLIDLEFARIHQRGLAACRE